MKYRTQWLVAISVLALFFLLSAFCYADGDTPPQANGDKKECCDPLLKGSEENLKILFEAISLSMQNEQKIIQRLSTSVQITSSMTAFVNLFIGIVVVFMYRYSKESINVLKDSITEKLQAIPIIAEKQAVELAEKDMTKIMEKLHLRDQAILNQRRSNLIKLSDNNKDTPIEKIIDIMERMEEFSNYVSLLFFHPKLGNAENQLKKALYYFEQNPTYYITRCLKAIRFDWRENARILEHIDKVLELCEAKNPAPGSFLE